MRHNGVSGDPRMLTAQVSKCQRSTGTHCRKNETGTTDRLAMAGRFQVQKMHWITWANFGHRTKTTKFKGHRYLTLLNSYTLLRFMLLSDFLVTFRPLFTKFRQFYANLYKFHANFHKFHIRTEGEIMTRNAHAH